MTAASKEAAKFLKQTVRLPTSQWPYRPSAADLAKYLVRCTDDLYSWQRQTRPARATFTLHDGPPYANGELHVGHALNKIIKDIIVRSRLAEGKRVDYVPGWDCHGLPIEQKVLQLSGWKRGDTADALKVRTAARKFAYDTVKKQMKGFRSWGIMADWDNHWKTLDKDFEVRQLEVFKVMTEGGLIYRKNKPVYWSPSSGTALAEAEIEYNEKFTSTAALIKFPLSGLEGFSDPVHAVIYTTTPWTIPANQAIAINEGFEYVVVQSNLHGNLVIAKAQIPYLEQKSGENLSVLSIVSAAQLLACTYANIDVFGDTGQDRPIYHADFVKYGSGTGLVHCAPGHGKEDFVALETFIKAGRVQVKAPVDDQGRYTEDAASKNPPCLRGLYVFNEGNEQVLKLLRDNNRLLTSYPITHSYPIDWRTKEPVMIRATAQWFADVSVIKHAALASLDHVTFKPETGEARLRSFVNNRSEWCISRQRAWGVPIPALYHKKTGEAILTPTSINHIISVIQDRGINAWWSDDAEDSTWIPANLNASDYQRGTDTMDVWFDSGSSWTFMQKDGESDKIADVYVEGSDQHRGWFQSSLLTSIAHQNAKSPERTPRAPFRNLITHGFTLDEEGKKMSKSEGNVIAPDQIIAGFTNPSSAAQPKMSKKHKTAAPHGPDALRLWAASSDWTKDVTISQKVVSTVHTTLDKYRNTFKLLLGMLGDFDLKLLVPYEIMHQLDQIALLQLYHVSESVRASLRDYEFHKAIATINQWINNDLSGFYIEAIKDVIYCGSPSDHRRHSALTVLYHVFSQFQHMLGPITPLLIEETYEHSPKGLRAANPNPHQRVWESVPAEWNNETQASILPFILSVNSTVKAIQEQARSEDLMGSSLESEVLMYTESGEGPFNQIHDGTLKEVLVVSGFTRFSKEQAKSIDTRFRQREAWALMEFITSPTDSDHPGRIVVRNASHGKCARCWKFEVPEKQVQLAESSSSLPLCQRCEKVVAEVSSHM